MIEIKFRAWDKAQKKFYYFSLKDLWAEGCEGNLQELIYPKRLAIYTEFPYTDMPIEQFTGLSDRNGKEIYKGDILDINIDAPVEAFWHNGSFLVRGGWLTGDDLSSYADRAQIIGTISENPELLGVKIGI